MSVQNSATSKRVSEGQLQSLAYAFGLHLHACNRGKRAVDFVTRRVSEGQQQSEGQLQSLAYAFGLHLHSSGRS